MDVTSIEENEVSINYLSILKVPVNGENLKGDRNEFLPKNVLHPLEIDAVFVEQAV